MTHALKTAAQIALIPLGGCLALIGAGLMLTLPFGAPAQAGGGRAPVISVNPVTPKMQQDLNKDFTAVIACIGPKLFDEREKNPAVVRLEDANRAAGLAALNFDLAGWNAQAKKLRDELPGLNKTYGCPAPAAASPAPRR